MPKAREGDFCLRRQLVSQMLENLKLILQPHQ